MKRGSGRCWARSEKSSVVTLLWMAPRLPSMIVFAVLSKAPDPKLRERIEQRYPDRHYHWTPVVSFVSSLETAISISNALGVKSREMDDMARAEALGDVAVLALGASYWGWTDNALWEWIASQQMAQSS